MEKEMSEEEDNRPYLIKLADQASCATDKWEEEHLHALEMEITTALNVPFHARWLRDLDAAMTLVAISPEGGGPIYRLDGTETFPIRANLASRSGEILAFGIGGVSEGAPQAVVTAVLRRECYRRQAEAANEASSLVPQEYSALIEQGHKAWERLHFKAVRDPELDEIKEVVNSLSRSLQCAYGRAQAAEAAVSYLFKKLPPEDPNGQETQQA
jgi:hypothetical protein